MGQTLTQIAQQLNNANKKVQLIYAFNGTGKTRLSREIKELIAPKNAEIQEGEEGAKPKVMYYNAFTEDLFYWDNDLDNDTDRILKIKPSKYTNWVLVEQGQVNNLISHFQRYTNDKLTPNFNPSYSEVRFSFERGDDSGSDYVKISKGEESCFIWSVFFTLLEETIDALNVVESSEPNQFDELEYIFIDDPVSSLDDGHLIELAVNIAELIKSSQSEKLKFIITTHNPLFYNVLFNEFNNADARYGFKVKHAAKRRLEKKDDGTFQLYDQSSDSPFSYHLFLFSELEKAIESGNIQKYHYNFLRNILEKTSTFLGHSKWRNLLPEDAQEAYYNRIINLSSHSKHHGEEVSVVEENDRRVLGYLVDSLKRVYGFQSVNYNSETEQNATV